jgi:hypothetical protein
VAGNILVSEKERRFRVYGEAPGFRPAHRKIIRVSLP